MADISSVKNKLMALPTNQEMTSTKLREVSDMYEQYFIKEMMKQMRSTVTESGLLKVNNGQKIFQEQLDDQYATEWNKRGGFGVSDLIYNQLSSRYGLDEKNAQPLTRPAGPISFERKNQIKLLSQPEAKSNTTFLMQPESLDQKTYEVTSPWAGVLQDKKMQEGDKTSFQIKHDNGLESLIMIQGGLSEKSRHLSVGDQVDSGQALGLAQSPSPLVWTVTKTVPE